MTGAIATMHRLKHEELRAELGKSPKSVTISLPWPPKELSPNARVHWAVKDGSRRAFKEAVHWHLMNCRRHLKGKREFRITFRPPSRRRADTDNMLASFKAGLDALSIVTGVDDSLFVYTLARGEPVKGGAVEVEFAI